MAKNPLANAGNTGSIPDPGRSHMLWSNKLLCHHCRVCAPEPRSPHAASVEAHVPGDSRRERLEHRNKEEPPAAATGEKPSQPWRPSTAKNKTIQFLKKKLKKKKNLVNIKHLTKLKVKSEPQRLNTMLGITCEDSLETRPKILKFGRNLKFEILRSLIHFSRK